jgi:hypothetical protein
VYEGFSLFVKELQLLSSHSFETLHLVTASETLELTLNRAQDSQKFLGYFHILFINMELVDRRQNWINMSAAGMLCRALIAERKEEFTMMWVWV